jgi:hypothetical protein
MAGKRVIPAVSLLRVGLRDNGSGYGHVARHPARVGQVSGTPRPSKRARAVAGLSDPHRSTTGHGLARFFPPVSWSGARRPEDFGSGFRSYPGPRPAGSFLIHRGRVHGLDPRADGGWVRREGGRPVDLSGRSLVLAYGSNLDPRKLARRLPGAVVVALRCVVLDHIAVWCDARRRNGDVVATLEPAPGRVEVHGTLALTAEQLEIVDHWEGHPLVYERRPLLGKVVLENGLVPVGVSAYIGTALRRPPLRRAGRLFPVAEHPYASVDALVPQHGADEPR